MLPTEWVRDFRGPAIVESLELVPEPQRDDPAGAGISCCLPTEHAKSALKTQKWATIICLVMGFAGLGGGAALASLAEKRGELDGEWLLLGLAMCSSLFGFICLILPVKGGGLFLRGYLSPRLDELRSNPDISEILYVGLEDPATFSKMKAQSDDAGYLALDPMNRRVIIEGVLCRYVIRAEDVIRVKEEFAVTSPGTLIAFRIGEHARLGVVIERQSLWAETVRQLTGRIKNPTCKKIAAALGVDATPLKSG